MTKSPHSTENEGGDAENNKHGSNGAKVDLLESNTFYKGVNALTKIFDGPATMFRNFVEKSRKEQPYYHRVYRRVPTVDECPYGDHVCIFEANEQFMRDRKVDKFICQLLTDRVHECYMKEGHYEGFDKCKKLAEDSELAHTNYFIKYGELSATDNCIDAYMKQKHRLIWQRRHPGQDIVGLDKQKEKREKLAAYRTEMANNPHKVT